MSCVDTRSETMEVSFVEPGSETVKVFCVDPDPRS